MRIKDVIAGFVAKGNTFRVPVDLIVNRQSQSVSGVRVVAQVPQGITLTGIVGQGVFVSPNIWDVGTVMPMNSVHSDFEFTYDDDTINEFEIVFTLFAAGCQSCFADTELKVRLHIASCADCKQIVDEVVYQLADIPKDGVDTTKSWVYPTGGGNTWDQPIYKAWIHLSEAEWTALLGAGSAGIVIPGFDKTVNKISVLDFKVNSIHVDPANGFTEVQSYAYVGWHIFYDYGTDDDLHVAIVGGAPAPGRIDEALIYIEFIKQPNIHP